MASHSSILHIEQNRCRSNEYDYSFVLIHISYVEVVLVAFFFLLLFKFIRIGFGIFFARYFAYCLLFAFFHFSNRLLFFSSCISIIINWYVVAKIPHSSFFDSVKHLEISKSLEKFSMPSTMHPILISLFHSFFPFLPST